MPRGVYERKKKTGTAAPVAAKPAPAKKAAPVKAAAVKSAPKAAAPKAAPVIQAGASAMMEAQFGFQILGSNISTLSEALALVKETPSAGIIENELVETVRTLTALRAGTFGELTTPVTTETAAPAEEEIEKVAPPVEVAPAPVPVAAVPSLPQPPTVTAPVLPHGNASPYQPPAPPVLPGH
jgi:hypothetical protein